MRKIFTLVWMMLIVHNMAQADTLPDYKVTLRAEQLTLKQVLMEIEKQTGLFFVYSENNLSVADKVSIHVINTKLEEVLAKLLQARGISWKLMDKAIVLKPAASPVTAEPATPIIAVVKGTVTNGNDEPLPRATVQVKGTNNGTYTNAQGTFTLNNVPENATVQFRYTGFEPAEVSLAGRKELSVKLQQQVKGLDETVVVAYGTTTQRSNTGSVAVIRGEEIQTLPNRSFDKSLQGLVPGLLVTNGTGQPGGGVANMVLRGISTGSEVFGNSTVRNPLIVIDGIPVTQDMTQTRSGLYATPVTNPLAQLNPSDIETVSVLKDAAAIALYGTKASNGVILVTTKKGQPGKTNIVFRSQADVSFRPAGGLKVLDQASYLDLLHESYRNANATLWTDAAIRKDLYSKFPYRVNGTDTSFYPAPDWNREVYENRAATFTNELSLSGGNERSLYYLNMEYTKQKGIVKSTGLDRKSVRLNFSHRPAKWIKFGINSAFSYTVQDLSNITASPNEYALASLISPLNPIRKDDGSFVQNYAWGIPQSSSTQVANPVAVAAYNTNQSVAYRGLTQLTGEISFLRYLSFSSILGTDFMLVENKQKQDPRLRNADFAGSGSIRESSKRRANVINSNILRFRKMFGTSHTVSALLGQEAQIVSEKLTDAEVRGNEQTLHYYDNLTSPGYSYYSLIGTRSRQTMLSQFSQLNYDFQNKYFFSGSVRRDGASVFGDQQQWGTYWSAGAGWVITAEPFLSGAKNWLNFLKLRGSLGASGNSGPVGDLLKYNQLIAKRFQQMNALTNYSSPGNPVIQWEETFTWDAGLEARLLRERLLLTADVYNKRTSDLIYTINLPSYTGYTSTTANVGDIKNSGIELSLTATVLQEKQFSWRISANWSTNRNVLLKANVPLAGTASGLTANEEGRNFNSYYLRQWAGVNTENGKPLWIDSTGKTTSNFNAAPRQFVGKPQPDGFGSVTNSVSWRGLELAIQLYYQYGYQLYNDNLATRLNDGSNSYINQSVLALDRWQKPGDLAANPQRKLSNTDRGNIASTRFLMDADYVRIQYAKLTYHFPKNLLAAIRLSALTVFLQANNLGIWTKFSGMDPDNSNVGGGIGEPYPIARTYAAGLNIQL